jgi:hypothetical protein
MHTKIHPAPNLSGSYDLRPFENAQIGKADIAQVGIVRIGAGTRRPSEGLRASARHEIAFIVEGPVRCEPAT